jgi:protein ImuB
VVRAEGPERIAMEWWRQPEPVLPLREQGPSGPFTRAYFRVEAREGRRFWLYRDGLFGDEVQNPRWYVHGLFAGWPPLSPMPSSA